LRVRLAEIDKLDRDELMDSIAKIIDVAKEAGVIFGPPPNTSRVSIMREESFGFMSFTVANIEVLHEQAEKEAMRDARNKALRLAQLSGNRLGEIRSVTESAAYVPPGIRGNTLDATPRLDQVEVTVTLNVTFRAWPEKESSP
jgi:hypothetical protein